MAWITHKFTKVDGFVRFPSLRASSHAARGWPRALRLLAEMGNVRTDGTRAG